MKSVTTSCALRPMGGMLFDRVDACSATGAMTTMSLRLHLGIACHKDVRQEISSMFLLPSANDGRFFNFLRYHGLPLLWPKLVPDRPVEILAVTIPAMVTTTN